MVDTKGRYLVQCSTGDPTHVMQVVAFSELEAKCAARAESGKLDALCLSASECPACVSLVQRSLMHPHSMYFGCPMEDIDGNCADDCPCKAEIPSSPWVNQVEAVTHYA